MLGTDKEPGIYVRTLNDLFRAIEETSDDMLYSVSMSYLEVRVSFVTTNVLSWRTHEITFVIQHDYTSNFLTKCYI